jgi:hypothetical protein
MDARGRRGLRTTAGSLGTDYSRAMRPVLIVALVVTAVLGFIESLESSLCEGQAPGVCEKQEDDATVAWVIAGVELFALFTVSALRNRS